MATARSLYHFTCHVNWHFIKTEGITRGDTPISLTEALVHPNLTSNPNPVEQLWSGPRNMKDKTGVRLTVEIPSGDDNLISWREFTDLHKMTRRDYRVLDEAGGWQARNWWIYRGVVRPEWITDVDFLGQGASEYERALLSIAEKSSSYDDMIDRVGGKQVGGLVYMPDLESLLSAVA